MKEIPQLSHSIAEVEKILDLCHQTVYTEVNSGRLRSYKVGKRRLVSREAIEEWIRARERECGYEKGAA